MPGPLGPRGWPSVPRPAAYTQGPEAAHWLETRRGHSGLVVWADGSTTVVEPVLPAAFDVR